MTRSRIFGAVAAIALVIVLGAPGATGDAPPPTAAPRIVLESPSDGWTDQRVVRIAGVVEGFAPQRVSVVLNGIEGSVGVEGGRFAIEQVLAPGWNGIAVHARDGATSARASRSLYADVPRKDLRITLTWDTAATDIDLHITGPDGETISYERKQGKAGGTLDTDVTQGYGPETYTQSAAPSGTYRVVAHYYGAPDAKPTRFAVSTVLREGTPDEEREVHRGVLLAPGERIAVVDLVVP